MAARAAAAAAGKAGAHPAKQYGPICPRLPPRSASTPVEQLQLPAVRCKCRGSQCFPRGAKNSALLGDPRHCHNRAPWSAPHRSIRFDHADSPNAHPASLSRLPQTRTAARTGADRDSLPLLPQKRPYGEASQVQASEEVLRILFVRAPSIKNTRGPLTIPLIVSRVL